MKSRTWGQRARGPLCMAALALAQAGCSIRQYGLADSIRPERWKEAGAYIQDHAPQLEVCLSSGEESGKVKKLRARQDHLEVQIENKNTGKTYQARWYYCDFSDPVALDATAYRLWIPTIHEANGFACQDNIMVLDGAESKDTAAQKIAEGLATLKAHWIAETMKRKAPGSDGGFGDELKLYQMRARLKEEDEGLRRFMVRAKLAVKEKRFEDAAGIYSEALEAYPWWADGRYNRGFILAELGQASEAMDELKRYLLLLPGASDARQVKDKIYELEEKAASQPEQGAYASALGLYVARLSKPMRKDLGYPSPLKGAVVVHAVPGGPADKAGLKQGDLIQSCGGASVASLAQIKECLRSRSQGASAKLKVLRGKKTTSVELSLAGPDQQ